MQQVDRHALTTAALRPRHEGGEHGDGCVERGDDVDDRNARLRRRLGRPGDAHQPADRLHERVVAGQVAARSLAEAADLAVDDAPDCRATPLVVEPEALERARLEVRDDDVRALAQLPRQLEVGRVLEVEHDRALVAVGGVVVRRAPLRVRRRQPAPRVVAGRRLDLDHVRAEIAERLADERPREDAGEVDHEDPVERRRHARDANPNRCRSEGALRTVPGTVRRPEEACPR